MKNPKIIFLAPKAPPSLDGVGQYTYHLTAALRKKGMDAHFFTSAGALNGTPSEWFHPVIETWTRDAVLAALKNENPAWISFQYVPQLYGKYGICSEASRIPSFLKEKTGCKSSVVFHEFAGNNSNLKNRIQNLFLNRQTRMLLQSCDLPVTTCEKYRMQLQKQTKQPVALIPVGSNHRREPISQEAIQALKQGHKILGTFGRLSESRNFPLMIRTLAALRKKGIPAKLILVGNTEASNPVLFQKLRDMSRELGVEEHLIVTGILTEDEISAHFQLLDLFLFPQCDGLSSRNTTIMTAMAHGTPILAFTPQEGNWSGPEIPNAYLVPQKREDLFIAKASELLGKNVPHGTHTQMIHFFEQHFSWDAISSLWTNALGAR